MMQEGKGKIDHKRNVNRPYTKCIIQAKISV